MHLSKIKVVVIGCMDFRFAKALYEDAKSQGFREEEIMFISVGGGIIQYGEGREKGLETILDYVLDNAPGVDTLIATGHVDRCGAVATWTKAPKGHIHKNLGPKPGSHEEFTNTSGLIIQGISDRLTHPKAKNINIKAKLLKLHAPVDEINHEVQVDIIPLNSAKKGQTVSSILVD